MYSWQNQVFRFIILLIGYMVVVALCFLPYREHWRELIINPYIIFIVVGFPLLLVWRIIAANHDECSNYVREKLTKFDLLQEQDIKYRNKTPLKSNEIRR